MKELKSKLLKVEASIPVIKNMMNKGKMNRDDQMKKIHNIAQELQDKIKS